MSITASFVFDIPLVTPEKISEIGDFAEYSCISVLPSGETRAMGLPYTIRLAGVEGVELEFETPYFLPFQLYDTEITVHR